jgi:hypothetical protein
MRCGTNAAVASVSGISGSDSVSARSASTSNQIRASKACSRKSVTCARAATRCEGLWRLEPQGAADSPWVGLAAGARGANHQAGNRLSLIRPGRFNGTRKHTIVVRPAARTTMPTSGDLGRLRTPNPSRRPIMPLAIRGRWLDLPAPRGPRKVIYWLRRFHSEKIAGCCTSNRVRKGKL